MGKKKKQNENSKTLLMKEKLSLLTDVLKELKNSLNFAEKSLGMKKNVFFFNEI